MKHVIIGTAGHVDHGKTSLIQALTGTNTDRLKEEQERGMTIDIGFASLRLPDGNTVGIVDVPGHERFLRNMLAGATGVDVALLVIAADEGIMPQTTEHLDLLRLLNVTNGVVAITKCDTVDRDWLEVVEEDIRTHLKSTCLSKAPILRVSSVTGKGIDALKKALLSAVSRATPRSYDLPFRLPVDRVFSMPGFGTVVTGTLVAGTVQIGDLVELMPQKLNARVRGLQIHNRSASIAEAGSRVAVNVTGVSVDQIQRGMQLVAPGSVSETVAIDVSVTLLTQDDLVLQDMARVRLHIGTAEVIGRIRILDARKRLTSGETAYLQFTGEAPFAAMRTDRFILRTYSPMHTIGGGFVLDASAVKHKKSDSDLISRLEKNESGSPRDLILAALMTRPFGMTRNELSTASSLTVAQLSTELEALCNGSDAILGFADTVISTVNNNTLISRIESRLSEYHTKYPLRGGIQKEEIRTTIGCTNSKLFNALVGLWVSQRRIRVEGSLVALPDYKVEMNERQIVLLDRIEEYYVEHGIATPIIADVSRMVRAPVDAVSALLKVGVETGRFKYVADGVYYAAVTVEQMKQSITQFLASHDAISVGEFRDITESNRKFAMQALEYLDSIKFTARVGDTRKLA